MICLFLQERAADLPANIPILAQEAFGGHISTAACISSMKV